MSLATDIMDEVQTRLDAATLTIPLAIPAEPVFAARALPDEATVIREWLPNYEVSDTTKARTTLLFLGLTSAYESRSQMRDVYTVGVLVQKKVAFVASTSTEIKGVDNADVDAMDTLTEEIRRLFELNRLLMAGPPEVYWAGLSDDATPIEFDDLTELHIYTALVLHQFFLLRDIV